jgi:serine/threonine protein kinase
VPTLNCPGGRYRLLERIGAGGIATVHRAWDERLERVVAVKVIRERLAHVPSVVRRFRREAELCARLAHPKIVAILDVRQEPEDFVVLELVRGLDAGQLMKRYGRLTPTQTVHVIAQVCEALEYAHSVGVVHRDVAPGNILVALADGTAKLADFGAPSDAPDVLRGRVIEVTGTAGYLAPERLRGHEPTPRSDLYSLGAVAYRLLVGPSERRPGATAPMTTAAARLPPLAEVRPGLPPALNSAIEQALAEDPHERQDSVAQFRAQIGAGTAPQLVPAALPAAA